jgi:2-polyprenyl-6-methoxyphenol hydroxylase-like FAD-dependent oxidoreductase
MPKRAIVIGGGIAGLSAAIALGKADYEVSLYEQAPEIGAMGAALSIWGNAMSALAWLGVADHLSAKTAPITAIEACSQAGRTLFRFDVERAYGAAIPAARLPTRTMLQFALMAGAKDVSIQLGQRLARYEQSAEGVAACFEDGSEDKADLLIIADGIWSPTALNLLRTAPRHCGYGGVLALSEVSTDSRASGLASEYWGRGERFGLLDIGEGKRYWFFMRNEASPEESRALKISDIQALLPLWPSEIVAAVESTNADSLIPFSIHAKTAPKRLGLGRIICVGDAAHAMEPNLGQGGCQALEDAVALGIAAQQREGSAILPLFEAMRVKRVRQFVNASRSATVLAQSRNHALAAVGRAAISCVPNRLGEASFAARHRLPDYAKTR